MTVNHITIDIRHINQPGTKTVFGIPSLFVDFCLNKFRLESQLDVLIRECSELIEVLRGIIQEYQTGSSREDFEKLIVALKKELTHVLISSAFVATIYSISEKDVQDEVGKE